MSITAEELKSHLDMLKAAGVSGPVEIHGIKLTIPPPEVAQKDKPTAKSLAKQYDMLLFAATEGIPDEEASE